MDGLSGDTKYPVVLRFEGLYPHQLAGYEAHRTRRGGDLGHVDKTRSHLNRLLIGKTTWAADALAEIRDMTLENYDAELASLAARGRKACLKRRIAEGPKQPWRPTRSGPMREVILTVNQEWFEGGERTDRPDQLNLREAQFERYGVSWLRDNFGDDVVHARADRDEAAYHIHAVIVPREVVTIAKKKETKTGKIAAIATRRMLQPSKHTLIRDYRAAQDSVGVHFADLGLVRGERRAAAIREACKDGKEPPTRRTHVPPAQWRAEEQLRLTRLAEELEARQAELKARATELDARRAAAERRETQLAAREGKVEAHERQVARREDEAETIIGVAEAIACGEIEVVDPPEGAPPDAKVRASKALSGPAVDGLKRRSLIGFGRAARAFATAWAKLRARGREKAEEALSVDREQIAEADEAIAEAAVWLPEKERSRVATLRKTILPRLNVLDRRAAKRASQQPPSTSPAGTEGQSPPGDD
jgi:hypothetical protein